MNQYTYFMELALKEAKKAKKFHEVPVGAVIVNSLNKKVIAKGYNKVIKNNNPTHHAEIIAISNASKKIGNYRLCGLDLYVTLEPCPMCAGAIMQARLKNVYFGASDSKGGAIIHNAKLFEKNYSYNHKPFYCGGILQNECSYLLKNFFNNIRKVK